MTERCEQCGAFVPEDTTTCNDCSDWTESLSPQEHTKEDTDTEGDETEQSNLVQSAFQQPGQVTLEGDKATSLSKRFRGDE